MKTFEKETNGTVTQVFDENGKLISQSFFAGDEIDGDIEAENFYAPFDMIQPDSKPDSDETNETNE